MTKKEVISRVEALVDEIVLANNAPVLDDMIPDMLADEDRRCEAYEDLIDIMSEVYVGEKLYSPMFKCNVLVSNIHFDDRGGKILTCLNDREGLKNHLFRSHELVRLFKHDKKVGLLDK